VQERKKQVFWVGELCRKRKNKFFEPVNCAGKKKTSFLNGHGVRGKEEASVFCFCNGRGTVCCLLHVHHF
jgi:hypothetical protein